MLTTLDKFLGGAIALIFVFLLVNNAQGSATVFDSLAKGTGNIFRTLQGRG